MYAKISSHPPSSQCSQVLSFKPAKSRNGLHEIPLHLVCVGVVSCSGMRSYNLDHDDDRSQSRRRLQIRDGSLALPSKAGDRCSYGREHDSDRSRSRQRLRFRDRSPAVPPKADDMRSYGREHEGDRSGSRRRLRIRDGSLALLPKADDASSCAKPSHVLLAPIPKREMIMGASVSAHAPPSIPCSRLLAEVGYSPRRRTRANIVKVPPIAGQATAAVPKVAGILSTASESTCQMSASRSNSPSPADEMIESTVATDAAAAAATAAVEAAATARQAATAATAAAGAAEAAAAAATAASSAVTVMSASRRRSHRR